MVYEIAAPRASALVEALRGVGYSPATAIADLVDNSISAGAGNVSITFHFEGDRSRIAVLDDGTGMSEDELRRAMVLGSRSPLDRRTGADLGRFGLGLKTASFSQARSLTVASRQDGKTAVRRWDLDYLLRDDHDEWRLLSETRPGSENHLAPLEALSSGALVLWEVLDRLTAGSRAGDRGAEDAFNRTIAHVEGHLSMVFHRYLEGPAPALRIHVNGHKVKPWDPFLRHHPATEVMPKEQIPTPHGIVELQGFVLPHRDRLSEKEERLGGGPEGWAAQQGFYVYRTKRLLVAGGWLGLGSPRAWTMEEPFRLARLKTEFGNDADANWEIDIKKSVARPPRVLRGRMTSLAEIVRTSARSVFAHRGSYGARSSVPDLVPVWLNRASGNGYRINRDHPVVARALDAGSDFRLDVETALKVIEASVPVERIWLDTAERGEVNSAPASEPAPAEFLEIATALVMHWTKGVGMSIDDAIGKLRSTDPFQNYPNIPEQVIETLNQRDA